MSGFLVMPAWKYIFHINLAEAKHFFSASNLYSWLHPLIMSRHYTVTLVGTISSEFFKTVFQIVVFKGRFLIYKWHVSLAF